MLDVAIIGAGAAGLGAAKVVISKGLSFKVLEAASFIGRRARTDTQRLGVPYDVGCRTLYGGSDNPFVAYARETGALIGPAPQISALHDGERFLDAEEASAARGDFKQFEAEIASAHRELANSSGLEDRSHADLVDPSHPLARLLLQSVLRRCDVDPRQT